MRTQILSALLMFALSLIASSALAQQDYGHLNSNPQFWMPQLEGSPSQYPSMSNAPRPNLGSMSFNNPMPPNYKPSLSLSMATPPPLGIVQPGMYAANKSSVPMAPPTMEITGRYMPAMTKPAFSGNVMQSYDSLPIYRAPQYTYKPDLLHSYNTGISGFNMPPSESQRYSLTTGTSFLLGLPGQD